MEESLLSGLTPRQFLRRHWQTKPLLVRRALPGFAGVIGRQALFALAARSDTQVRLVERRGGRWRVTEGPIAPARRLLARIRWSNADVVAFLGRHLTLPRPHTVFPVRRHAPRARLEQCEVVLDPRSPMLYRGTHLFLNGEAYALARRQRSPLARLADRRRLPGRALVRAGLAPLLRAWHGAGALRLARGGPGR